MKLRRTRAARLAAALLIAPVAIVPMLATPAQAQWTVFDPSNYAQNLLTAARSLQQINNQITSLQNQAQSLINQARNLASLPYSSLQQLQQSVQRTQQLLSQAQNIAYNVQQIDQVFQSKYANVSMSASDTQLIADAKTRWQNTVGSLQDAMRVQATVVGNIDTNRTQMSALVGSSQSATGALQATQANVDPHPHHLPRRPATGMWFAQFHLHVEDYFMRRDRHRATTPGSVPANAGRGQTTHRHAGDTGH